MMKCLHGHNSFIKCIKIVDDCELVSGSCDDNAKIRIWSVNDGQLIKCIETGHRNWIECLELLPNGLIASGAGDKTIKLWNLKSGENIHTLTGHDGHINCLKHY